MICCKQWIRHHMWFDDFCFASLSLTLMVDLVFNIYYLVMSLAVWCESQIVLDVSVLMSVAMNTVGCQWCLCSCKLGFVLLEVAGILRPVLFWRPEPEAETVLFITQQWMRSISVDAMEVQTVWGNLTGPQTTLAGVIVLLLSRPGNSGTCSFSQAIRATPSKTHPWSGRSWAVWFQPSHWAHSTPGFG